MDNINKKVTLLPVRKYKKIISLSKFDGNRRLNIDEKIKLKINNLYELRDLKNTKNSKLNINEKDKLKQKVNRYSIKKEGCTLSSSRWLSRYLYYMLINKKNK